MRTRCKGDDDELSNAMRVFIHNVRIGIYSMIILNGKDSVETHYENNNITHYLCFCLGLSLGLPYHFLH